MFFTSKWFEFITCLKYKMQLFTPDTRGAACWIAFTCLKYKMQLFTPDTRGAACWIAEFLIDYCMKIEKVFWCKTRWKVISKPPNIPFGFKVLDTGFCYVSVASTRRQKAKHTCKKRRSSQGLARSPWLALARRPWLSLARRMWLASSTWLAHSLWLALAHSTRLACSTWFICIIKPLFNLVKPIEIKNTFVQGWPGEDGQQH